MLTRRGFVRGSLAAAVAASLPAGNAVSAVLSPSMKVDSDLDAVTGDGKSITLTRAAVQELGDSLRGNLLLAGHAAYDAARRVWNAQMDKHPALIVQPRGAADVQQRRPVRARVEPARRREVRRPQPFRQVDLRARHAHRPVAAARRARRSARRASRTWPAAACSATWIMRAMAHGLVTTAGTVSHTGVGGLTLGGGFGRVARRFGLALDNVRPSRSSPANGEILRASAQENPELYWGVRGGGGNFGVVTAFEFDLHPMQRQVIGGIILFPIEQAKRC